MDIHTIRQTLRTKPIYDIPLRVTFYARVSSESDEQLNSLGNQVSYYEEFIHKNTAWEYVQGYVKEFVDKYIDKIFVTPEEDGSLRLQIKVLTGESTDKYLQKLKRRTGHTFNIPVPNASMRCKR